MKKLTAVTAALGLAVTVLPVLGVSVALGQENSPTCDEATAVVADLEVEVRDLDAQERAAEQETLAQEQATLEQMQRAVDEQQDRLDRAIEQGQSEEAINNIRAQLGVATTERDAAQQRVNDAQAALETDSDALAGLRARLQVAVTERDAACDTNQPSDPPVDYDCDDFPLADGRTAQDVLEEDLNDPHALDEDGDLVACEGDDPAANPDGDDSGSSGGSDSGGVTTPRGGVNTGAGPA